MEEAKAFGFYFFFIFKEFQSWLNTETDEEYGKTLGECYGIKFDRHGIHAFLILLQPFELNTIIKFIFHQSGTDNKSEELLH